MTDGPRQRVYRGRPYEATKAPSDRDLEVLLGYLAFDSVAIERAARMKMICPLRLLGQHPQSSEQKVSTEQSRSLTFARQNNDYILDIREPPRYRCLDSL